MNLSEKGEGFLGEIPERISEGIPEESPGGIPKRVSGEIPKKISGGICEGFPGVNDFQEESPKEFSKELFHEGEGFPGRVPEELPEGIPRGCSRGIHEKKT